MGSTVVTAAAGKLILLEQNGTLHIVEATPTAYKEISSSRLKGTIPKFWLAPVLYRGRIYARNLKGDLLCVDVSS